MARSGQFPEVAGSVAPALTELVGDGSEPHAHDVMLFLRAALHTFADLRDTIYQARMLRLCAKEPARLL